jgi:ATP-dependent 26S proteasome regulatory subunit
MFGDRDASHYKWEARDVNVLLQELERFEGVCILATNRKIVLDRALERRISLKVEFERPDRRQRQRIWRKMFPKKMPLAPDVDLERLSEHDLVGGEIKNVVLNAARLAVQRGDRESVTMQDFQKALLIEKKGRWNKRNGKRIGFITEKHES